MDYIHRLTTEDRINVLKSDLAYLNYKMTNLQLMLPNNDLVDDIVGSLPDRIKILDSEIKSTETRIKNLIKNTEPNEFNKTLLIYTT